MPRHTTPHHTLWVFSYFYISSRHEIASGSFSFSHLSKSGAGSVSSHLYLFMLLNQAKWTDDFLSCGANSVYQKNILRIAYTHLHWTDIHSTKHGHTVKPSWPYHVFGKVIGKHSYSMLGHSAIIMDWQKTKNTQIWQFLNVRCAVNAFKESCCHCWQ